MKNYFRIMPGSKCVYFPNCKEDDFIGDDFDISHDLTDYLKFLKMVNLQELVLVLKTTKTIL